MFADALFRQAARTDGHPDHLVTEGAVCRGVGVLVTEFSGGATPHRGGAARPRSSELARNRNGAPQFIPRSKELSLWRRAAAARADQQGGPRPCSGRMRW